MTLYKANTLYVQYTRQGKLHMVQYPDPFSHPELCHHETMNRMSVVNGYIDTCSRATRRGCICTPCIVFVRLILYLYAAQWASIVYRCRTSPVCMYVCSIVDACLYGRYSSGLGIVHYRPARPQLPPARQGRTGARQDGQVRSLTAVRSLTEAS